MDLNTINREDLFDLFHELMQHGSNFRVLRLLGEAKLGKSHFLTKVFPVLAQDTYAAHCVVIDLRNPAQTIPDILHAISCLLGDAIAFPSYFSAYEEWINRPSLEVTRLHAIFSHVRIGHQTEANERRRMARHLVSQFIADLRALNDAPLLLLLFDTVDKADENIQAWLMDVLLVQLASLDHIRIVVSGRAIPEPSGSYASICHSYELTPVEQEDAYIDYCHRIGASLNEQSIRDFARVFDYKPGMFVDLVVPRFVRFDEPSG